MSIASQITALAGNISDAYDMVAQRGGTVPDRKNMENLDTAIATIPSGGPTEDYGTVTVADYEILWRAGERHNYCTLTAVDQDLWEQSIEENKSVWDPYGSNPTSYSIEFYFFQGPRVSGWRIGEGGPYTTEQLSDFGLTVDVIQTTIYQTYFSVEKATVIDPTHTTPINITNYLEYASLGNTLSDYSQYVHIDKVAIPRAAIVGYSFGSDCDTIPDYFLTRCSNFNTPISIPSGITKIGNYFLSNCTLFNSQITIPSTVTEIGNYFLYYCSSFNQPITIPSSVEIIGNYFIAGQSTSSRWYTQSVTIPGSVKKIGSYFLDYQPITGLTLNEGLESIGSLFLRYSPFNFPFTIPNTVASIGNGFLQSCQNFNQTLNIPSSMAVLPGNFLYNCTSFNSPIDLSNVTEIGSYFLSGCTAFNSTVTLGSNLTAIGNYFLNGCSAFNKPMIMPNSVTSLGTYFMAGCSSFNSSLSISSGLTTSPGTNQYFMQNCTSFAQPLTIPSGVYMYSYFMFNCNNFTGPITTNTSSVPGNSEYRSLSTTNSSALCYTTGITIKGPYRSNWINGLPNRTSSPYRKLIDGGA